MALAMDRNRLIGSDGGLPWSLPADLARFKAVTLGKPIIMGRRTCESIGRALPGRRNIVITSNPQWQADDVESCPSLSAALDKVTDVDEAVIIGGAQLCRTAMPITRRLYLTVVDHVFDGDTWLDSFDRAEWVLLEEEHHAPDAANRWPMRFQLLERTAVTRNVG